MTKYTRRVIYNSVTLEIVFSIDKMKGIDLGCAYKRFDDNKSTLWISLVHAKFGGINSDLFAAKVYTKQSHKF
jgi:hypothetical protein